MAARLIEHTPQGLYCPAGGFHIDPWRPVQRAVVTHAHADHARPGHRHYLAAAPAEHVMRQRLGEIDLQTLRYGEAIDINGVRVSLHPAGHVLGSAQVRVAHRGEVWVVSGDYKLDADPTCTAFEPVPCHTFISESTFGLPIYRWATPAALALQLNQWWRSNAAAGRTSVLFAYAFGKAQRVLASVDPAIGPIVVHGAVAMLNAAYRASGVALPDTFTVSEAGRGFDYRGALVVAPPSAQGTPWLRRFGEYSDAFASGWMAIRGARRQRSVDLGLALSDHADWPGLHAAITATGAGRVLVTHGQVAVMVRYLRERGLEAEALETEYEGEAGAAVAEPASPEDLT